MNEQCKKCRGECCRWVTVPIMTTDYLKYQRWFRARGIVGQIGSTQTAWNVPTKCPHLSWRGRCKIYARRPKLCCEFVVDGPECQGARALKASRA